MRERITTLAELMKLKWADGSRFVLMLGAGASLSSGVPPTATMMQELLGRFGTDIPDGDPADRFDTLWGRSTEDQRRLFLTPSLQREPSSGYLKLARIIQEGYCDLVITFNYDDLLRKALVQTGFDDFREVIRGDTEEEKIPQLVEEGSRRKLTILKLHGSLYSTNTFLFDRQEMLNYPPLLAALFARLTSRDIVVCGYAFADMCVTRAFSTEGGSVFWVNPSGAPIGAKAFMKNRRSGDFVISGELGMFDRFFSELEAELFPPPKPPDPEQPRSNPFKFLESFDIADRAWFFGRDELSGRILEKVAGRPGVLHLIGAARAGKTSLVRAGVLAGLDEEVFKHIYLRCRPDFETQLREELAARLQRRPEEIEPGAALQELAAAAGKHVVLVLDQFERALKPPAEAVGAAARLVPLIQSLHAVAGPSVTLLFVAVDEAGYTTLMWKAGATGPPEALVEVAPFSPEEALAVVEQQATRAGLRFAPGFLAALRGKFAEHAAGDGTSSFTLAHLQAICYLLARRAEAGRESYAELIDSDLEGSLDSVIRECDIMNFVEDFPARYERRLVRSLLKAVPPPSRRIIAKHIQDRFADLQKEPPYPEPF